MVSWGRCQKFRPAMHDHRYNLLPVQLCLVMTSLPHFSTIFRLGLWPIPNNDNTCQSGSKNQKALSFIHKWRISVVSNRANTRGGLLRFGILRVHFVPKLAKANTYLMRPCFQLMMICWEVWQGALQQCKLFGYHKTGRILSEKKFVSSMRQLFIHILCPRRIEDSFCISVNPQDNMRLWASEHWWKSFKEHVPFCSKMCHETRLTSWYGSSTFSGLNQSNAHGQIWWDLRC